MPITLAEIRANIISGVVANYSALPAANTVSGQYYNVLASEGYRWLFTYKPKGIYYSNGSTWDFRGEFPSNADQPTVDAGTNDSEFLTPLTFTNATKWNTKADKTSSLVSGGAITMQTVDGTGVNNDAVIAPAIWYIVGFEQYQTLVNTTFLNIALSSTGLQRYVGFYGDATGTIVKVEGAESEYAAVPTQPANTALIGYILVTDSSAGSAPDLSPYALINPRVLSVTSSAAPTYNITQYDELYITALAADVNLSTNMTGVVGHGKSFIINIKDNGTPRLITMGTKFAAKYASLPTTTTANKNIAIGCKWNSNTSKFDVWVVTQEP